jgi:hypothetical protein
MGNGGEIGASTGYLVYAASGNSPRVVGVDSDGGVAEHGLKTGCRDDNLVISAIDLVRKRDQDSNFDRLVVARNLKIQVQCIEQGHGRPDRSTRTRCAP